MPIHRRASRSRPRSPRSPRHPTTAAGEGERTLDLTPEQFWDLHGVSLFALARALLGDRESALRAVCLAMVDLYSGGVPGAGSSPETLRRAAGLVYRRCEGGLARPPAARAAGGPPATVRLGELATAQRVAVALCVYGGHTYQLAAARLGLPPDVVAGLLSSGLRELSRP